MKADVTAADYMRLTALLYQCCFNPGKRFPTEIEQELDSILATLASDNLDFKQARTHQGELQQAKNWINSKKGGVEIIAELPVEIKNLLVGAANTIFRCLYDEGNQRHLLTLDLLAVPDRLRSLEPHLIDIESKQATADHGELVFTQRILLGETIRCLETGAYRSAMVMGWNLTFKYVRQWMFLDAGRLKQFNDVLTIKYRNKSDTHSPIVEYTDFFAHNEAFVLDVAFEAKLFDKHAHQTLKEGLNNRNHFAHPTFMKTDREIAAGQISKLVANIITQPAFRYFS